MQKQRNKWNFQIKLHCSYLDSNGKGLKDFLGSFNRQLLQKLWKFTLGFKQKNDIDLWEVRTSEHVLARNHKLDLYRITVENRLTFTLKYAGMNLYILWMWDSRPILLVKNIHLHWLLFFSKISLICVTSKPYAVLLSELYKGYSDGKFMIYQLETDECNSNI